MVTYRADIKEVPFCENKKCGISMKEERRCCWDGKVLCESCFDKERDVSEVSPSIDAWYRRYEGSHCMGGYGGRITNER